MINIQDYLVDDNDDVSPLPLDDLGGETVSFVEKPSRQEIGKWVDRLLELPHDGLDPRNHQRTDKDDPYLELAEILLSNKII